MNKNEMLAQLSEAGAKLSSVSSKSKPFCWADEEIFFCEFDNRKFDVWVWSIKKEAKNK